jgi:hypothetical protein
MRGCKVGLGVTHCCRSGCVVITAGRKLDISRSRGIHLNQKSSASQPQINRGAKPFTPLPGILPRDSRIRGTNLYSMPVFCVLPIRASSAINSQTIIQYYQFDIAGCAQPGREVRLTRPARKSTLGNWNRSFKRSIIFGKRIPSLQETGCNGDPVAQITLAKL